jgi:hypothetical protein
LWRTTIGYRIRTVGLNPAAARYAGIPASFYVALALILGGLFAGLAGAVEVTGIHHRALEGMSGGYGFSGIVAALFGKLHPLGAIPVVDPLWRAAGGGRQDAARHPGAQFPDYRDQRPGGHVRGGQRCLRAALASPRCEGGHFQRAGRRIRQFWSRQPRPTAGGHMKR